MPDAVRFCLGDTERLSGLCPRRDSCGAAAKGCAVWNNPGGSGQILTKEEKPYDS